MALYSPCTSLLRLPALLFPFVFIQHAWTFTSSTYQLDAEYSGNNFFDGWDFYTVSESERRYCEEAEYNRAAILPAVLSRKCSISQLYPHTHRLQIL